MKNRNTQPDSRSDAFTGLYGWILLAGFILFLAFIAAQYDLWERLFEADSTYLSALILCMFAATSAYLGWCAYRLGLDTQWLRQNEHLDADFLSQWDKEQSTALAEHFQLVVDVSRSGLSPESLSLKDRLVEQLHGRHANGWFLSDLMIRLGLLGTVIGFILMLGSVNQLNDQGIQVLQQLLTQMSGGMKVALMTTLTGLASGMLLALQCQWLDRCADRLVSDVLAKSAKLAIAHSITKRVENG